MRPGFGSVRRSWQHRPRCSTGETARHRLASLEAGRCVAQLRSRPVVDMGRSLFRAVPDEDRRLHHPASPHQPLVMISLRCGDGVECKAPGSGGDKCGQHAPIVVSGQLVALPLFLQPALPPLRVALWRHANRSVGEGGVRVLLQRSSGPLQRERSSRYANELCRNGGGWGCGWTLDSDHPPGAARHPPHISSLRAARRWGEGAPTARFGRKATNTGPSGRPHLTTYRRSTSRARGRNPTERSVKSKSLSRHGRT